MGSDVPETILDANLGRSDEVGVIRYDWPSIKLTYVAGAGCTEIARSLTSDCPEEFDRVRSTISQRCSREEWQNIRENGQKLAQNLSANSKNSGSRSMSQNVATDLVANVFASRKSSYLDTVSEKVVTAADHLKKRDINSLEDASIAFKLMEPVHKIAESVFGLNAKESPASLQVNILSQGGDVVVDAPEITDKDS